MPDLASRADVARLFGRAAFGATRADLDRWAGQPYEAVVDGLFPPGPPGTVGRLPQADEAYRVAVETNVNNQPLAQRWWLERMRTTPYPLEERMTLFWHDHFATAIGGRPNVGDMVQQNQTLRMHALGSFRDFANAMTVDPSMLFWLNGITNHRGGVNENYAREFFELFTLGVLPQVYTEADVREAAKAFTGFVVNAATRAAQFTPARHNLDVKTVLGRTFGGWPQADARNPVEYKEVTEAALAHDGGRTSSRFLAYKLVTEFGYPPPEPDVTTDPVIEAVAAAIRADDAWDIEAGVRTMLLHPGWRNPDPIAAGQLVRSPIELVVHASKVLGLPCDFAGGTSQNGLALTATNRAGQSPLVAPSVAGWPNGANWLSNTTTLARYDMFNTLMKGFRTEQRDKALTPLPASADIAGWTSFMGLDSLSASTTLRLQEYLAAPGTTVELDKQTSMFILVGSSPDWQVL